jgi:vanillate O-demethylase ferredoxin subunit
MVDDASLLPLQVRSIAYESSEVWSFELVPTSSVRLPSFEAGAHIDVHLPNRLVRQYSLTNESDGERYVIAVGRDRNSRGGSRWLHEQARPGDALLVGAPRNTFRLVEDAPYSIFLAGGIGITPIQSMIRRLRVLGRAWSLHYAARTRPVAAFVRELAHYGESCDLHFDDERRRLLDIPSLLRDAPREAHFYCCGPAPMIDAFRAAVADVPAERVHLEYFAPAAAAAPDGSFTVELARTGTTVHVSAGQTILDALIESGLDVAWSCRSGVCGTCETRVLDGMPEHRDMILSDGERASGRTMMICCSRASSPRLLLDL